LKAWNSVPSWPSVMAELLYWISFYFVDAIGTSTEDGGVISLNLSVLSRLLFCPVVVTTLAESGRKVCCVPVPSLPVDSFCHCCLTRVVRRWYGSSLFADAVVWKSQSPSGSTVSITRVVNIFEDYSWAFVVITCLFA
jgi:hypothetical protein